MEDGEWKGFSDRELKSLRKNQQPKRVVILPPSGPQRNAKPSSLGESGSVPKSVRQQAVRGGLGMRNKRSSSASGSPVQVSSSDGIPQNAFFTHPARDVQTKAVPSKVAGKVPSAPEGLVMTRDSSSPSDAGTKSSTLTVAAVKQTVGENSHVPEADLDSVVHPELKESPPSSNLELLQKRQKEIEAENKKKKELVQQTLQERYKKTENEARTLEAVKLELNKVDNLVMRDVSLLREKIEEANRQYTAARKRYELAETEFIAAKQDLHSTSETKELLSEHLCNVIQQNEIRKAKKLAELLQVLNVESGVPASTAAPLLPALLQRTPTPGLDIWPKKGKLDTHKTGQPVPSGDMQTKFNSAAAVSGGAEEMPASPGVHSEPPHDQTQSQTLGSCVRFQSSSTSESNVEHMKDSENAASASACTSPTRNTETGSTGADSCPGVGDGKDGHQCEPSSSVDKTDQRIGSASHEGLQLENQPVVNVEAS